MKETVNSAAISRKACNLILYQVEFITNLRKNGESKGNQMKILWALVNLIQIVIIFLWTAVCGISGMLLMLFLRNGSRVHLIEGKYLWSPVVCAVTGVRVRVKGLEHVQPERPAIYVANHASHFDIVAISRVMPVGLFFVAKKELSRIPVMGQYMRLIGHIFVDRKNKDQAMKSMHMAAQKIQSGKNVISFPEGTRSKTGKMNLFKRGSFIIAKDGAIDIVPIAISGSDNVLASGSFAIRPGTIDVVIGERIPSSRFAHLQIEDVAALAQASVQALLNSKP
jgi:1-acyl-sn-glycerol-3-phosphate acyltransferase